MCIRDRCFISENVRTNLTLDLSCSCAIKYCSSRRESILSLYKPCNFLFSCALVQASAAHAWACSIIHPVRACKHESIMLAKSGHVSWLSSGHSSRHRIFPDLAVWPFESWVFHLCFGQSSSKSVGWIKRYDHFLWNFPLNSRNHFWRSICLGLVL